MQSNYYPNDPHPPTNQPLHPSGNYTPYPPAPTGGGGYPPSNSPQPPENIAYPPANNPYPPLGNTYAPTSDQYPPVNNPYPSNTPYAESERGPVYPNPNPPQYPPPQNPSYAPNVQYAPVNTISPADPFLDPNDRSKVKPVYDEAFDGPTKIRECTDVFFIGLFVIFMGVWVGISAYAYGAGNLKRVIAPIDSLGQICGVDNPVASKPYLYFFDLTKCRSVEVGNHTETKCFTPQVCIEKCPDITFNLELEITKLNWENIREDIICVPGFDKNKIVDAKTARDSVTANKCVKNIEPSYSLAHRCFPKAADEEVTKPSVFVTIIADLQNSWYLILILLILGMIICFVITYIMKWVAAGVMWTSLFATIFLLAAMIGFSIMRSAKGDAGGAQFIWVALFFGIILLIILGIIFYFRRSIKLAIKLIKEGSRAVVTIADSIFFPLLPYLMYIAVIIATAVIALSLYSIGDPKFEVFGLNKTTCVCTAKAKSYENGETCEPAVFIDNCFKPDSTDPCDLSGCFYDGRKHTAPLVFMQVFNIIAFLWSLNIITAFGQMVLAMAFSTWYWTRDKTKIPSFVVKTGISTTFRYHIGTLSFGSLIITICDVLSLIADACRNNKGGGGNVFMMIFCTIFKCLIECLEKFIEYINKNAYIMCAIHGKNFCISAKAAFFLILRNVIDAFVVKKVANILFGIIQVFITCITASIAYGVFYTSGTVEYTFVPTLLVGLGTIVITTIFFDVYKMAIDTIFICFLEDLERNDGTDRRPYFMSASLKRILKGENDQLNI